MVRPTSITEMRRSPCVRGRPAHAQLPPTPCAYVRRVHRLAFASRLESQRAGGLAENRGGHVLEHRLRMGL